MTSDVEHVFMYLFALRVCFGNVFTSLAQVVWPFVVGV